MTEKLYEIISKVMSVPVSEINDQSGPANIKKWDSFNTLVLIDELESQFNVQLTMEEAIDLQTVADVKRYLKNHKVYLNDI
jgi:acyl carrier protein